MDVESVSAANVGALAGVAAGGRPRSATMPTAATTRRPAAATVRILPRWLGEEGRAGIDCTATIDVGAEPAAAGTAGAGVTANERVVALSMSLRGASVISSVRLRFLDGPRVGK